MTETGATTDGRASVLTTVEAAVDEIKPGATVGFGGLMNSSHSMPIVREIIRRGIGDLHLVGLASGIEVDMLVAAGLVRRISTPTVSAETIQAITPGFRWAAQSGRLEIWDCDEGMVYAALQAAAHRVSFAPWPVGMGSSYPEINDGMEQIESPYTGRPVIAIRAIEVDFCFIHCARADVYGNIQAVGGGFGDRALARASRRVFATVEQIVGNHEIRRTPELTSIAGVDGVIQARWGSHPLAAPGYYIHDEKHIRLYLDAADALLRRDDRGPLDEYFAEWVHGPESHAAYLEKVGLEHLFGLEEGLNYDPMGRRHSVA